MVSHAMWKTWPSGLSYDKNLGLRPRFLSTESLGPCFSHGMGDHDQILQHHIISPTASFHVTKNKSIIIAVAQWPLQCKYVVFLMKNESPVGDTEFAQLIYLHAIKTPIFNTNSAKVFNFTTLVLETADTIYSMAILSSQQVYYDIKTIWRTNVINCRRYICRWWWCKLLPVLLFSFHTSNTISRCCSSEYMYIIQAQIHTLVFSSVAWFIFLCIKWVLLYDIPNEIIQFNADNLIHCNWNRSYKQKPPTMLITQ